MPLDIASLIGAIRSPQAMPDAPMRPQGPTGDAYQSRPSAPTGDQYQPRPQAPIGDVYQQRPRPPVGDVYTPRPQAPTGDVYQQRPQAPIGDQFDPHLISAIAKIKQAHGIPLEPHEHQLIGGQRPTLPVQPNPAYTPDHLRNFIEFGIQQGHHPLDILTNLHNMVSGMH